MLAAISIGCGPSTSSSVPVVTLGGSDDAPQIASVAPTGSAGLRGPVIPLEIAWLTSEVDARSRSRARKLPLLVFVSAEWVVPVMQMDRETWNDPRILDRSRDFVALRVDVTDAEANAQAAADRFDVASLPSTIVYDDTGHEAARLEGFASADQVLAALQRAAAPGD